MADRAENDVDKCNEELDKVFGVVNDRTENDVDKCNEELDKVFGVVNDRAATDVDERNEEMDKVFGVEYDVAATLDDDSNEEMDKVSGVVNDVKEVLSRVEMLIDEALTHFSSQSSEESQEITDTADGDAATVVNSCQQSQVPQPLIDMLSAVAPGNLRIANDSEDVKVNCRTKKVDIKMDEGANFEMDASVTDIGNKSKESDINLEKGRINITMGKDSKMTFSSMNKIGNDVSEKEKIDITSNDIDIVLKEKSELDITEEMNIANSTQQAEVVIKTDHQKFECGEGARAKLFIGAGGLNTALQQEHQDPEFQEEEVWSTNAFRVVLMGNTKSGKSSTGNTIINKEMNPFFIGKGFKPSTLKCQTEKIYTNDLHMTVTDTPELWSTEHTVDEVYSEILKSVDPGPHAILLVKRLGTKFTDEDIMLYQNLKWVFGDSVHKYIIVVFAGVDQVCDSEWESYEKMEREIKVLLQDSPNSLSSLLSDVQHRYIPFNNKARGIVNDRQREKLFEMIELMVRANNRGHVELQIRPSFDIPLTYPYHSCCCWGNASHYCKRLEVQRWYGQCWYDIPHKYICHQCGSESSFYMRCDRNVPHDCTILGIENTKDQRSFQSKVIENTILQSKVKENTSLQSNVIENTSLQNNSPIIAKMVQIGLKFKLI